MEIKNKLRSTQGDYMRLLGIGLCGVLVVGFCGVMMFGQAGRAGNQRIPAPTDKAVAWTDAEMKMIGLELGALHDPAAEHRFFREQSYNMEVRRLAGPQPILQHSRRADFMVIQDGEGTFVSGGEIVNGKPFGTDAGELRGDSIRGGVSQVLKTGDVMFVPPGLPHAFVETKDHVTVLMVGLWTR
jgi:mannose-6-phosphate isomerase-like protein (cupin superfamily)